MNILYMNQGGGGEWGAIKYSTYDVILLAESQVGKDEFSLVWKSKTLPIMSIQQKSSGGRIVIAVQDVDTTAKEVRPLITCTLRDGIRVVFMHLKSGNEKFATQALDTAIQALKSMTQFTANPPILWIGDFNRALGNGLVEKFQATEIYAGGGQAIWDLDRAYISGDWSKYSWKVYSPAKSSDHGHVAIAFEYE